MWSYPRSFVLAFAMAMSFIVSSTSPAAAVVPAKVTGIKATPTTSSVTLTWAAAANAKTYRVCLLESDTSTTCLRKTDHSTSRTATITNLAPTAGTDYYARIYAWNGTSFSRSDRVPFNLVPPAVKPAQVTGLKAVPNSSGATLSWNAAANAKTYRVCLLTNGTTNTCSRTTGHTTALTTTITGLQPTGGTDYYFKVYAWNSTAYSSSERLGFNLPVGAISTLATTARATNSFSLSWSAAVNAENYGVELATNSAMTSGRTILTVAGLTTTASSLVPGTRYYYRVRGLNGAALGAYTSTRSITLPTAPFNTTVITYNLCGQDKCVSSSNGMKRWTTRKPLAGSIARSTGADIIATQESHIEDTRFGTELPGYALGAYYSAKSLFYKTDKYTKLRSGTITLDSTRRRYAVWAELRDKATRTRFIVSDAHLEPYKGRTNDDIRYTQTRVLLAGIKKINTPGLPVVYAGDYNSNKSNLNYTGGYDAPLKVFTAAGIPDTVNDTTNRINLSWNSSNQAKNPPLKHADHIDHVFVDPRIDTLSWRIVISIVGSLYKVPFATDHNPVRTTLRIPGMP